MVDSTLIVILCCAFSLAFAFLLFFALYSRSIEPFDERGLVPMCKKEDMDGEKTLGGNGHIYIVKDDRLKCIVSEGNNYIRLSKKEETSSQTSFQKCADINTEKIHGGDGRLYGIERNDACVY
jgi:hypothetical protein